MRGRMTCKLTWNGIFGPRIWTNSSNFLTFPVTKVIFFDALDIVERHPIDTNLFNNDISTSFFDKFKKFPALDLIISLLIFEFWNFALLITVASIYGFRCFRNCVVHCISASLERFSTDFFKYFPTTMCKHFQLFVLRVLP